MDTLLWGQIVIVLLDKFMNANKKQVKYLCALGIFISGLAYIFVLYPAWQVSFGYVFLALVIWILIKNIKYGNYKFTKHDVIVVIITLLCILLMLGRWYLKSSDTMAAEMNTDYPGDRQETGGGAYNLYSYFYNIFFTFEDFTTNPCEYSSMLSFYPIPILLGLIYVIRNRKDLYFWIPILVISLFLTVWCVWGFPAFLANITMMSMTTPSRVSIPLGTVCIYILIYLFANFDTKKDKLINKKLTYVLSVLFTVYIIYRAKKTIMDPSYLDKFKLLLGGEIFLAAIWGILNLNNEKIKNYTLYGLIIIALMSGLRVNPVIRTTDIFYTKPVSIKMQEIRDEDPDAIWAVVDGGWYYNDYAVANGIRTINSTNVYPNLEMYEEILGDDAEEYKTIYNRYAHVILNITEDKSSVELLYADQVALNLNYNDLEKLDIEYILSTRDLTEETYSDILEELYDEDGMYIYKVTKGN